MHEMSVAKVVAAELEAAGMDVEIQNPEGECANVVAVYKGSGARPIMVGGHIDTVDATDKWTYDPFTLTEDGDLIHGLGAGDMKGGIAALITVLRKMHDDGVVPSGDIIFVAVGDEERFSVGANYFTSKAYDASLCIFAEPHFFDCVIGATGKILLEMTIRGRSGHAARPDSGVSAIESTCLFLNALDQKYRQLYLEGKNGSHCALRISSKYEGYSLNIPDECSVMMNKQLLIGESETEFIDDLYAIFANTCNGAELEVVKSLPYYPSYKIDVTNKQFVRLMDVASKHMDKAPQQHINAGVSDGNVITSKLRIPSVLFGPQGIGIHSPDDSLVVKTAYMYIDIMYEYLSGEW